MKAAVAATWLLTLVAAYALGRLAAGPPESPPGVETGDLRAILSEPDPLERSLRLSTFLDQLGPEHLPEALEALGDPGLTIREPDAQLLMLAWARFDPAGAFETARQWPGKRREMLEQQAIWAWGFLDGPGALRALEASGDPELIERLRWSLVFGWLRSEDRQAASEYVAGVEEPRQRRRLTFLLTGEIMRDGADAVMRWAESLPEDLPNNFKGGAFYYAINAIAQRDPRLAAEWFVAHRAQLYSAGSLVALSRKWTYHHDAPGFFEWLLSLPSTGERQNERADAAAAGFSSWYNRAPEEAMAWLEAAPRDPVLDPAVADLVRSLSREEPGAAIVWAQRIQDPDQRRRSTQLAGRRWAGQDMEAARAWLAQADVSEELAHSILRNPKVAPAPRAPAARSRVAPAEPSTL